MKIGLEQTTAIKGIVNLTGGNFTYIKDAIKDLGSSELISCSPGPDRKYISREELGALGIIQRNITGEDCPLSIRECLIILEEALGKSSDPEQLNEYLKKIEKLFPNKSTSSGNRLTDEVTIFSRALLVFTSLIFLSIIIGISQYKNENEGTSKPLQKLGPKTSHNPSKPNTPPLKELVTETIDEFKPHNLNQLQSPNKNSGQKKK